jgi:hypothetical protein
MHVPAKLINTNQWDNELLIECNSKGFYINLYNKRMGVFDTKEWRWVSSYIKMIIQKCCETM